MWIKRRFRGLEVAEKSERVEVRLSEKNRFIESLSADCPSTVPIPERFGPQSHFMMDRQSLMLPVKLGIKSEAAQCFVTPRMKFLAKSVIVFRGKAFESRSLRRFR